MKLIGIISSSLPLRFRRPSFRTSRSPLKSVFNEAEPITKNAGSQSSQRSLGQGRQQGRLELGCSPSQAEHRGYEEGWSER